MTDLPSLDLVRALTDEFVVRHLMGRALATRAEIAARSGISKTTVSESVRRLAASGFVVDSGQRSTGRGRAGSYYSLAPGLGVALVVGIAPEGIVADTVDAYGGSIRVAAKAVKRDAGSAEVRRTLAAVVRTALTASGEPIVVVFVSAADPVERGTGVLVHLPDAPFLVGEISPVDVIGGLVAAPVHVDNDVNWAAIAERCADTAASPDDFAYVFLGEGLGCAVVSDGVVVRGRRGLAGEIAHAVTTGPGGRAMAFTDVFAHLHLRRQGSTAIDVDLLLRRIGDGTRDTVVSRAVAAAIAGVLASIIALIDPGEIVLGGEWGGDPRIVSQAQRALDVLPRRVQLRSASVIDSPSLVGARLAATESLRAVIVERATTSTASSSRGDRTR